MSAVAAPPLPIAAPMPAAPTTAPPAPKLMRWTVDEFHRVGSTNIWESRRAILLRGVLMELGPMNARHGNAVELTNEALRTAFGTGWRVRVQLPLVLGFDTDPMPDFAVLPGGPRDTPTTHPTTAALVVEVSDSSLQLDLTEKAELYAAANVPDYWVLDLEGRRLVVLRDPAPVAAGGFAYRTQTTLGPTDTVSPLAVPTATIRVSDLLP